MNRRVLCALLIGAAAPLSAQIGSSGPRGSDPGYWVGLSYGYVDGISVSDNSNTSSWQFSYSSQIRATFEKMIQGNISLGASAGYSTADLRYSQSDLNNPCGASCDATADISQYFVFVRGGSGTGFHGLFNVEAGVTGYSNFRTKDNETRLPPTGTKYDFTFGLGGGIGYGFTPITEAYVAEQVDLVLHPNDGGGQSSAPRMNQFRAGFRIGF